MTAKRKYFVPDVRGYDEEPEPGPCSGQCRAVPDKRGGGRCGSCGLVVAEDEIEV